MPSWLQSRLTAFVLPLARANRSVSIRYLNLTASYGNLNVAADQ